jgi:hypothetical protein
MKSRQKVHVKSMKIESQQKYMKSRRKRSIVFTRRNQFQGIVKSLGKTWRLDFCQNDHSSNGNSSMGLYRPLDGITNLKYKLLYFVTPNKKISKRKALAFNQDRCCHLPICLWLILFYYLKHVVTNIAPKID